MLSAIPFICFAEDAVTQASPMGKKYAQSKKTVADNEVKPEFIPIKHASMVMKFGAYTVFVDPVGDFKEYSNYGSPDIILITDIHRDHLDLELIKVISNKNTIIIVPPAAREKLGYGKVLKNGKSKKIGSIKVEAIPMYNISPSRLKYHEKGRGNGYILTINRERIYISGDTEDIPEMRALKDIDYAFLCMNLPYTMTVEQAASATLDFKPGVVIPYHYRGTNGMSDIVKFKKLVSENADINVMLLGWYEDSSNKIKPAERK